jgi:hypothetical protein
MGSGEIGLFTEKEMDSKGKTLNEKEESFGYRFNQEGPSGVEGQVPPADKDLTSIRNKNGWFNEETSKDKKIYFGYLTLTVKEIEKTRNEIVQYANKLGGYVENLRSNILVIRVPKAEFAAAIDKISLYGVVTDKSIETFDVSEEYQDLSLRLDLAKTARARLQILLESTVDVKERLKILKEIQRLTEEIDSIGRRISTIGREIAFSKISVTLNPRISGDNINAGRKMPFEWIRDVAQIKTGNKTLKGKISLNLPDDFALLEKEKYYYAENPQGLSIELYTVENKPEGDTDFWQSAVYFHLQGQYQSAEKKDYGKLKAVLFESNDQDPFYMLTGVVAFEKELLICKIIFPNSLQYKENITQIEKLISEMEYIK